MTGTAYRRQRRYYLCFPMALIRCDAAVTVFAADRSHRYFHDPCICCSLLQCSALAAIRVAPNVAKSGSCFPPFSDHDNNGGSNDDNGGYIPRAYPWPVDDIVIVGVIRLLVIIRWCCVQLTPFSIRDSKTSRLSRLWVICCSWRRSCLILFFDFFFHFPDVPDVYGRITKCCVIGVSVVMYYLLISYVVSLRGRYHQNAGGGGGTGARDWDGSDEYRSIEGSPLLRFRK